MRRNLTRPGDASRPPVRTHDVRSHRLRRRGTTVWWLLTAVAAFLGAIALAATTIEGLGEQARRLAEPDELGEIAAWPYARATAYALVAGAAVLLLLLAGPPLATRLARALWRRIERLERSPIAGFLARRRPVTWVMAGVMGSMAWQSIFVFRFFMADLVAVLDLSAMLVFLLITVGSAAGICLGFPLGTVRSRKQLAIALAIPAPAAFVGAGLALPEHGWIGLACLLAGAVTTGAIPVLIWDRVQDLAGGRGRSTSVSVSVWAFALLGLGWIGGKLDRGWLLVFVSAVMGLLCVLIWLFVESDERKVKPRITVELWLGMRHVLMERKTLVVVAYSFFVAAAYGSWAFFYQLHIGAERGLTAVWIGGGTIAAGGLLSLVTGSLLWDRVPRAVVVLVLLVEALAAAVGLWLSGDLVGLFLAGLLWEWGSTVATAGAGHLAKWGNDDRDPQRAIVSNLARALGPVLPLTFGFAFLAPDADSLAPAEWAWAHGPWIPVLLVLGLAALASSSIKEISRAIAARALMKAVERAATATDKANLLIRRYGLRAVGVPELAVSGPIVVELVPIRRGRRLRLRAARAALKQLDARLEARAGRRSDKETLPT